MAPPMVFPRAVYTVLNVLLSLAIILCSTNAQSITRLSTTLSDGIACANTDVTFTCETLGSFAIAWRSEQFIGDGNTARLIFSFDVDSPGSTRNGIDSTTVATLTRNELVNGTRLLESTLRVRAPESSSTPLTVTCVQLDNDEDRSVNFSVLSVPGEAQNADVVQVPCVNSSACLAVASWSPPSNSQSANITHYIGRVTVDGAEVFTTMSINAGSNAMALSAYYVVPTCTNFQNVGWSLVAVNQCGEGPTKNALLLPNPASNIGQVICLADIDQPTTTSPSGSSAALTSSMWIVNGAVVLAMMKDVLKW